MGRRAADTSVQLPSSLVSSQKHSKLNKMPCGQMFYPELASGSHLMTYNPLHATGVRCFLLHSR